MYSKNYKNRTMKKRRGGAPLGVARRDGFKQGVPKSRSSKKVSNPPPLNLKPLTRSPSPIHRLPSSSSSSKKSSSGSFKRRLPSKKKNKGQQKVNVLDSFLSSADRALAKQRNTGLSLLTNIGVATKGK